MENASGIFLISPEQPCVLSSISVLQGLTGFVVTVDFSFSLRRSPLC